LSLGRRSPPKRTATGSPSGFPLPRCRRSIAVDRALLGHDDQLLRDVALSSLTTAQQRKAQTLSLRRTVAGIGAILSVVLLDEHHDITGFPRGKAFLSYGGLGQCTKESAGKRYGTAGTKSGNAHLTWACSEAAVLCLRANPAGQKSLTTLEKKHG